MTTSTQQHAHGLRAAGTALAMTICTTLAACNPQETGPGDQPQPRGQAQAPEPAAGSGAPQPAQAPPAAASHEHDAGEVTRARATLEPTEGSSVTGAVELAATDDGALEIEASLMGLTPGTHGLHVHEVGDCSAPDGSSAGEHFAPQGDPHGAPRDPPAEHHAGDLGNITAADDGTARKRMTDDELTLTGDFGVVGRAIVVHEGEDDLESQPSGNSGNPVACGVIEAATA